MQMQLRYEKVLGDMLSLFQEALYRFLTNQTIDLQKFKHYFMSFTNSMAKMEEQFQSNRLKLTKKVNKLLTLCNALDPPKFSLQPQSTTTTIKIPHKTKTLSLSKQKTPKVQSLNVIGEQDDQRFKVYEVRRRSGTAGCSRPKMGSYTIEFENGRPLTGQNASKVRYEQEDSHYNKFQTVNISSTIGVRKNIYEELAKEVKEEPINEETIKIPAKRRNDQRKSFKINKLF